MEPHESHARVIAARRELISGVSGDQSVKGQLVRLADALLLQSATDPAVIAEVEELLAFSNAPDAARSDRVWPRQAQTILGYMYRGIGRLEDAVTAFAMAYNWCPDLLEAAELLADVYCRMGRRREADAVMTEHRALLKERIDALPAWSPPATPTTPASLYLDLLEKVVCNWIYRDNCHPSYGSTNFDIGRRDMGRDLPTVAHSMIGRKRLRHLRWAAETVLAENVPGDFIEAGVWRGGACILMRGVLAAHAVRDRQVYAADSFAGLPSPDARFEKDLATLFDFDSRPELGVGLEEVRQNFAAYDLLDDQVSFVVGWFKDTLPKLEVGSLSVLRLDGDLYASTMDTINCLYAKVSVGGFIICDDYGVIVDAQRAVLDFRRKYGITSQMFSIDGDGVFWRKEAPSASTQEISIKLNARGSARERHLRPSSRPRGSRRKKP